MKMKPCIIGIDFGTTSLSAVIINVENMRIEKVFSRNTNAYIPTSDPLVREQSIDILTSLFYSLLDEIKAIPDFETLAYGFTGQMHGIVGVNSRSEAVTNLVTWEDKSGDMILSEGGSLLDKIKLLSGDKTLSNGYGIITLYKWLNIEKRVGIHSFCTIADYFAGLLAKKIVMSPTMAHSIGLFDIHANKWIGGSIDKLGLKVENFPQIVGDTEIIGYTRQRAINIPIVSALGDNQASFLGSVSDKSTSALLNVGTGAQVSFLINKNEKDIFNKYIDGFETQLRPYDNDSYLIATSFVNGGSVYKSLFNFFREVGMDLFNLSNISESELWSNMEKVARNNESENKLKISPLLAGQRMDSGRRGEITNIDSFNFHPGNLITGFLVGLAEYYKSGFFSELSQNIEYICGSGNGLKRNKLFVEIIERTFLKSVNLTPYNEEAAVGAALNAAKAIGVIKSEDESKNFLLNLVHETLIEN